LLPTTFGQPELHQSIRLKKVFEGAQTVDLQFDEFPKGSGSLECRVVDKNGKAVERFHFMVIDDIDWEAIDYKGPAGGYLRTKVYRMDVDNTGGGFTVEDLPAGNYKIWVIPKDGRYKDKRYEDTTEKILIEEGAHVKKIIEVPSKYVLYGRVLFEDGSPAVVEPTPWPGAKSSIFVPMGSRARGIADIDDDGYFAVHLSASEYENIKAGKRQLVINIPTSQEGRRRTVGKFPFELLAEDRDKAGVVRVKRPEKQKLTKPNVQIEGIYRIRHFVRLVSDDENDRITFEGEELDYNEFPENLEPALAKIENREITVLEIAFAPGTMPEEKTMAWLGVAKTIGELEEKYGFEYVSIIGEHPLGSKGSISHVYFTGRYIPGEQIPVGLKSVDGLLCCDSIKFKRNGGGEISASLQLGVTSYPKTKWEVRIQLLDVESKEIKAVYETLENSGVVRGFALNSKQNLKLEFGKVANFGKAEKFEIRIRQIKNTKPAVQVEGEKDSLIPKQDESSKEFFGITDALAVSDISGHLTMRA